MNIIAWGPQVNPILYSYYNIRVMDCSKRFSHCWLLGTYYASLVLILEIPRNIANNNEILKVPSSSAQPNGTLQWNRDRVQIWEQFTLARCDCVEEKFTFRSYHKKFMSASPDGELEVDRLSASSWEQFTVVKAWKLYFLLLSNAFSLVQWSWVVL